MTTSRPIKRSEKLPRGSYFFLQVGHRFYAGEEAVFEEVKEATATLGGYAKDNGRRYRWSSWSPTPRKMLKRWKKSGRPGYLADDRRSQGYRETETTSQATGTSKPLLTDDLTKVKKFRRLGQAEAACARLEAMYRGFDVKVSVRLKEGV